MLITSQNTTRARLRVQAAVHTARGMGRPLQFDYEHGQWWVTNVRTGAQWSAVDATPGVKGTGIDFEQITDEDDEQ